LLQPSQYKQRDTMLYNKHSPLNIMYGSALQSKSEFYSCCWGIP